MLFTPIPQKLQGCWNSASVLFYMKTSSSPAFSEIGEG
jgi:hypothetical protein